MHERSPQTDFDPVATLEGLVTASVSEREAAVRALAADPSRFVAAAEAVRTVCSRSPDRGVAAAAALISSVEAGVGRPGDGCAAAAHRALVRALAWSGRFEEAIDAGRRAASIADADGPPEEAVRARLAIMHPLTELGRLGEAIETGRRASSLATDAGRPELAARADINLGIALRRRDEPEEAVACFHRARRHLSSEPAILASLENSLGEALVELQSFDDAEIAFARARDGFESVGAVLQAAIAEENLADLAYRQGRLHRALALFETARRRLSGEEMAVHRARVLAEEADARTMLGLLDSAVEEYAAALPMLDRFGLVLEAARARKGMGSALRHLDRPSEAATALAAASQAFTDLDHRTARARCDLVRAGLELDAGRPEAARRLAAAAVPHFDDRPADLASARLLQGEIAVATGQEDLAAAEFAAGLAIARELDLAPLLADLLHAVGRQQRRLGRLTAARATLDAAVEQIERVRGTLQARRFRAAFLGRRASVQEERLAVIIDTLDVQGGNRVRGAAEAFEASELLRHRELLDELVAAEAREPAADAPPATVIDGRDDEDEVQRLERAVAADRHALNVLYSRIGDATLSGSGELGPVREAIRARERQAADHIMRLEATGGGSPLLAAPVSLEAVRHDLPAGARQIVFAVVEGRLARFVIDPGGVHFDPAVASVAELEAAVRRLRFQIERGLRRGPGRLGAVAARTVDDARRAAMTVHELAFGDLPAAPSGLTRLIVVPDGPLVAVPPGVLHDGEAWLAARHAITVTPSAGVHLHLGRRGPSAGDRRLVVGVADEHAPEIEREAIAIAERLDAEDGPPVERLHGPEAGVAAVTQAMTRATAIHLAAHGRFDPEQPHASGLRLADRWLTVGDVARLRLDAELVTLSGCETGLGGREAGEVVGLVRALLATGVRRVVASQWRVDDAITRTVMHRVHARASENMLAGDSALDLATALSRAHDELLDDHPHPAHWGAFVLMGRN